MLLKKASYTFLVISFVRGDKLADNVFCLVKADIPESREELNGVHES